jgi:hypothetical protein
VRELRAQRNAAGSGVQLHLSEVRGSSVRQVSENALEIRRLRGWPARDVHAQKHRDTDRVLGSALSLAWGDFLLVDRARFELAPASGNQRGRPPSTPSAMLLYTTGPLGTVALDLIGCNRLARPKSRSALPEILGTSGV